MISMINSCFAQLLPSVIPLIFCAPPYVFPLLLKIFSFNAKYVVKGEGGKGGD